MKSSPTLVGIPNTKARTRTHRQNVTAEPVEIMSQLLVEFDEDRQCVGRQYVGPFSEWHARQAMDLLSQWSQRVGAIDFDRLSSSDRVDWILLRGLIESDRGEIEVNRQKFIEALPMIPFAPDLVRHEEDRCQRIFPCAESSAASLDRSIRQIDGVLALSVNITSASVAAYSAAYIDKLLVVLERWFKFYNDYDPEFQWWVATPYATLKVRLSLYREKLAKCYSESRALTPTLGNEALTKRLHDAMIYYSPDDLLVASQKELAWTETELVVAARELGAGDRWSDAVEMAKRDHLTPGEQPQFVARMADEAIQFIDERNLVTVPTLARSCWRMNMMSSERQKVNPFFLGGEALVLSFPTVNMEHGAKKMSQRGNNRSFTKATVYHELIPGHHLQSYMQNRHRPERRIFENPFWIEGWTLHWEMLFWELGFAQNAIDRVGMLFWRRHRAARVFFTISYHLGQMSAEDCVDYLVKEVGHERANAEAEVRRSFEGEYDPLYQLAYLIGGLQVHALYHEMTTKGTMTPREFHDAFLRLNSLPIVFVRALLSGEPITREASVHWDYLRLRG